MASQVFFANIGVIPDGPGASDIVSLITFLMLSMLNYILFDLAVHIDLKNINALLYIASYPMQSSSHFMNFSRKRENVETSWKCHSCMSGSIDTQSHILYCEAYRGLREGKSLSSDKDIVEYFRKVIEIRDKLGID